jgi:hypothetical protein
MRLLDYMHQLRHPDRFVALYMKVLAEQPPPLRTIPYAAAR